MIKNVFEKCMKHINCNKTRYNQTCKKKSFGVRLLKKKNANDKTSQNKSYAVSPNIKNNSKYNYITIYGLSKQPFFVPFLTTLLPHPTYLLHSFQFPLLSLMKSYNYKTKEVTTEVIFTS